MMANISITVGQAALIYFAASILQLLIARMFVATQRSERTLLRRANEM
jgi:hypothetical protein